jgi:protein-L-isoaspartate(D-aspartate) O-methyltransferase
MAWRSHGRTHAELVGSLVTHGQVKTTRVRDALLAVDRAHYVVDPSVSYFDQPLPIGHGATISAPHMHAHVLEVLSDKLQPGARVLDVGSGSGYLLAAFAHLVFGGGSPAAAVGQTAGEASSRGGRVFGIEHIPDLVEWSQQNLRKDSAPAAWLAEGAIQVVVGDGRLGLPEQAPFDAIHVGAAAPTLPEALIQQLAPGGRLVIPVGNISQELLAVDKHPDGSVTSRSLVGVMYIPLTSREAQEGRG